jgi:hypothetical protein
MDALPPAPCKSPCGLRRIAVGAGLVLPTISQFHQRVRHPQALAASPFPRQIDSKRSVSLEAALGWSVDLFFPLPNRRSHHVTIESNPGAMVVETRRMYGLLSGNGKQLELRSEPGNQPIEVGVDEVSNTLRQSCLYLH